MPESPRPYYTPPDPVHQLLAEITKPEAQLPAVYGLIGEPLSGKTEAVRYLQHELESRFPNAIIQTYDSTQYADTAAQVDQLVGDAPSSDSRKSFTMILIDNFDLLPLNQQAMLKETLERLRQIKKQTAVIFTACTKSAYLDSCVTKTYELEAPDPSFWMHTIQHMRSLCTAVERNRLELILDLFAALPSAVEFEVLCELSRIHPDALRALLDKLQRWFPEYDGEYTISHPSLCNYFATQPAYAARLYRSQQRVLAYYRRPFYQRHPFAGVPSCVLRHLPEMLVDSEHFVALLYSREWDWKTALSQRYEKSELVIRHALLRALHHLQRNHSGWARDRVFVHSTLALLIAAPSEFSGHIQEAETLRDEIITDCTPKNGQVHMSKYVQDQVGKLTQLDLPRLLTALSSITPSLETQVHLTPSDHLATLVRDIVPLYHTDVHPDEDNLNALCEVLKPRLQPPHSSRG